MTHPDESAFPAQEFNPQGGAHTALTWGLTKREYFAAMAMQGLVTIDMTPEGWATQASAAVKCADALIAELNKDKP